MPSRMSLFNKEMILQASRNVGWISITYFLVLLFILPIAMLMRYGDGVYTNYMQAQNLFRYEFGIQFALLAAVPVLLSVFLFRFLQVRQGADFIHSLPVKKEQIYQFYTVIGSIFLILPVILTAFIVLILHSIYGWDHYFSVNDIFRWAGITLVFNFVIYFAGIVVGMVTGISAVQAVLTYILLLFPAGISLLVIYNLGMLLYGFPSNYYQVRNIEYLSPITHFSILESPDGHIGTMGLAIYFTFSALFYVLALQIYKKRKTEAASEAIAFRSLRVIFTFGVTVCTMMLGGMYFGDYQRSFGWMMFGYAVGALIGYFAAEMVLQKTWRVFGNLRRLGIYAAVIAVLVVGIQTLRPYETHVPELEEIKSVTMALHFIPNAEQDPLYSPSPLKKKESIELARGIHEKIIDREKRNKKDPAYQQYYYFIYDLKDGSKVVRQYRLNGLDYDKLFKPLRETEEFKQANNPIFKINQDKVYQIRISDHEGVNKLATLTELGDIQEAISILKKEVLNETYEQSINRIGNSSDVELLLPGNQTISFELKSSYETFKDWLREKDLLEQATVTAKDVDYILVSKKYTDKLRQNTDVVDPERSIMEPVEKDKDTLKITDLSQIQTAMDNAGYGWDEEGGADYVAVFIYKHNNYREIRTFKDPFTPEFIKSHFAK